MHPVLRDNARNSSCHVLETKVMPVYVWTSESEDISTYGDQSYPTKTTDIAFRFMIGEPPDCFEVTLCFSKSSCKVATFHMEPILKISRIISMDAIIAEERVLSAGRNDVDTFELPTSPQPMCIADKPSSKQIESLLQGSGLVLDYKTSQLNAYKNLMMCRAPTCNQLFGGAKYQVPED